MSLKQSAAACAIALSLGAGLAAGCASGGGGMHVETMNDDAAITARVKTALLNDTQIDAAKIDVTTSGGVVTLAGSVKSQGEAERAVQLARAAAGVKDVKTNLEVRR